MGNDALHRVVIVGAGFAGLYAARAMKRAPVEITLIDSKNHHVFQPLLYQVATGALSPGDIASPIRGVLRNHRNTRVLRERVLDVDPEQKKVRTDGRTIGYDTLVVCAGLKNHYFGNDWEKKAPGLKSLADAIDLRGRVLDAFERAEIEPDRTVRDSLLTVAVVGAGPTGVELAGALAELARDTLRNDFRAIDPRRARIVILEAGERLLPAFHPGLSARAAKDLSRMGVEIHTRTRVTAIGDGSLVMESEGIESTLETANVVWSAGIRGAGLGESVAGTFGAELDKWGRVIVQADLTIPGNPEVFVAGDLAAVKHKNGTVPMVAPAAIQEGKHVAKTIIRRLRGKESKPFSYFDKGMLAVIGRNKAVVQVAGMRFGGFFAWLIWILIHILFLIEFDNRILVMFQWGWTYFTRKRGARLIID